VGIDDLGIIWIVQGEGCWQMTSNYLSGMGYQKNFPFKSIEPTLKASRSNKIPINSFDSQESNNPVPSIAYDWIFFIGKGNTWGVIAWKFCITFIYVYINLWDIYISD